MSRKSQNLCPHCSGPAQVRSSRSITPTYRVIYLQCHDVECGHTYVAEMTITHTIVPSQKPNARILIPFGVRRGRDAPVPTPANDPDMPEQAQA